MAYSLPAQDLSLDFSMLTLESENYKRNLPDFVGFHSWWQPSEQEAKEVLMEVISKFQIQAEAPDEMELFRKFSWNEVLANKATEAFLYFWLNSEPNRMQKSIDELKILFEECTVKQYIPIDYYFGLEYLIKIIDTYFLIKMNNGNVNMAYLKQDLDGSYAALGVKARVAIMGVQQYYVGCTTILGDLQIQITLEMIRLDPDFYKWYQYLYSGLRWSRRMNSKTPCDQEKRAIEMSHYMMNPYNTDPFTTLLLCTCFAEILSNLSVNTLQTVTVEFAQQMMPATQVLYNLQSLSSSLYTSNCASSRVFIQLAQIHSAVLPLPFRDVTAAIEYLKHAINVCPNSSRALHLMGVLHLQGPGMLKNNEAAIKYFAESLQIDSRNFGAVVDLCLTMMYKPSRYSRVVSDRIECNLRNNNWTQGQIGTLFYIQGCLRLGLNDKAGALHSWMEAHKRKGKVVYFQNFAFMMFRYGWDITKVNLKTAMTVFYPQPGYSQYEDRALAEEVKQEVYKALQQEEVKIKELREQGF